MLRVPIPWLAAGALLIASAASVATMPPAPPPTATIPATLPPSALRPAALAVEVEIDTTEAELAARFTTVYPVAMSAADPVVAFDALREARTIDMALGGRYAGVLRERMRVVAPRAAAAFEAAGDGDAARLARGTAEMSRP